MGWKLIDFAALDAADLADWRRTRSSRSALDSPFFHPAYAGAMHAVYGDVRVAITDDEPRAWYPLQVHRGAARPVGWPGSEFSGPIAPLGVRIELTNMLRDTGIRLLEFNHVPTECAEFEPWVSTRLESPFIDVSGGLDGYSAMVGKAGRRTLSDVRRNVRNVTRELGDVQMTWHATDPAVLDWLIEAKRAQYARTGEYDFFASPRRRDLFHRLAQTDEDGFAGVLSVLRAGETLLAAHFGVRDGNVLQYWFPVYDRDHARFGPGFMLLAKLVESAPDNHIDRIDLGEGVEQYKSRVMTGSETVYAGEMVAHPWRRHARRTARVARHRVGASQLAPPLRATRIQLLRLRDAWR